MNNNDTIFSDLEENTQEATYGQRVIASLIDTAIMLGAIVVLLKLIPVEIIHNVIRRSDISTFFFIFLLLSLYRLVCLLVFGKTIGMMMTRVKYLNEKLHPLTNREKLLTTFVVVSGKIKYYKGN